MGTSKQSIRNATAAAGIWEMRLLPFFQRHSLLLALAFIAIASLRIAATYYPISLTYDEPGHFACGLQYLSEHTYQLESQHPPLTRAAVAMGPYLAGVRLDPRANPFPGLFPRDTLGRGAFFSSRNPDRLTALMRLGNLPFFWLACLVVYAWAKRYFDGGVAVLATCLFTLLPPVLAHAGLATTDIGLCACLAAAFYTLLVWAESPTWKSGALLGVAMAAAALAKFTALVFMPMPVVLALLCYLAARRPGGGELLALARSHAPSLALAAIVGLLTIWAGYWFSFGVVPDWGIRLPAPEFFDGILTAARHNAGGHPAYLLGEKSMKGWWYYFPLMLSVKTPIAFLILLVLGVCAACGRRATFRHWIPLAFAVGILIPAMIGSINIGVRHILPVYCGLAIVAAAGLSRLFAWSGLTAGALVLWMAISGAPVHPDYLSYFNEFAPAERETLAVDSDLDWGQDMKLAARILHAGGATAVATNQDDWYTMAAINGLPPCQKVDTSKPSPGWNMIGVTTAKNAYYPVVLQATDLESLRKANEPRHPWWETMTPTRRVGGLLLYYIPAK